MKRAVAFALLFGASAAAAQQQAVIRTGMTEGEVRAAFGEPTLVRQNGSRSYLFYPNGCPVRCGSDDVVFLENGRVAMAVLRSPSRRISGAGVQGAVRAGPAAAGQPRRIVVGPREGQSRAAADGFSPQRPAGADTIRGPLQRADTSAALRPPRPVPGTPPADTVTVRPAQPRP